MADSVVSLLLETLNQLIDQDADLLLEVEDELRSFHAELGLASGFIRNSVGQGNAGEVEVMAKRISEVANRVEDDIDKLAVRIAKQRMRGEFRKCIYGFDPRNKLRDVSKIINSSTKEVKQIYSERGSSAQASSNSFLTIDRKIEEVDLPCFPEKMEILLKQLLNEEQGREVISIVGDAGIGKTFLAKKIYNDISVQAQFKYRAWVHVSRYRKAGELLLGILESLDQPITTGKRQDMTVGKLQEKLSKCLANNRYLIVLDDLQNMEGGWEQIIEQAFHVDTNGSKILFTCRPEPENSLGSVSISHSYSLERLDKAGRWKVLRERVFRTEASKADLELLGEQMAEKCEGLPLSLAILGRLLEMQGERVEAWSRLACCFEHSIHLHLLLNFIYEHLPDHLSLCLLYFGMFPKGAEIPTKQLIQLWMAEGFIQQKGSRKMEDVGQEYLEELIGLNLIQVTARRSTDGGVKTCQIQELIWKFCISKGREMKFLEITENLNDAPEIIREKTRRLAIHATLSSRKGVFSKLLNCKGVRSFHFSILGDNVRLPTSKWNSLYEGFKLLRVLNLGMVEVLDIPKEVGRLIHLRYLRIRGPVIKRVPSSICNLLNLQTLDMRESTLNNLPNGIWKLQQLRHLHLFLFRGLPERWGTEEKSLGNLQTLSCIRPQKEMKRLMVRVKFPNISKLKLASENPDETADFLESLDHLYHLQSLKIESSSKLPNPSAFPLTLTKITLKDTTLGDNCMKRLEKLPNLRILKLQKNSVSLKEINFNAGGFPQLEVLQMVELEITKWTQRGEAMVNLRHLVIKKCVHLTAFPNRLSSLQILEVILPTANLRKVLQDYGSKDGLKIMINPPTT
nr:putative late blight resistance protein homolog R1B-16 [Quercus suber]